LPKKNYHKYTPYVMKNEREAHFFKHDDLLPEKRNEF